MPRFVIKDLPEGLYRKLKEQAARHHRSMTQEVLALLRLALGTQAQMAKAPPPFRGRFPLTDRFLDKARHEGRQ